jgi:hypothetical protein
MASVAGRLWFACVSGLRTRLHKAYVVAYCQPLPHLELRAGRSIAKAVWAIVSADFMIKNRYAK